MATQADPSSSSAVAPGPRAIRLQKLYAQSLERALSRLSWDNFAACYPTVAARAEPVLRQVRAQMVDKLGEKCAREFEGIMEARRVVAGLNELERLVAEAAERRASGEEAIAPNLLPPGKILAAHMAPHLASHRSHLNARLQTVQSRNAMLHGDIVRQRGEIDELLGALERAVEDVSAANGVLAPVVQEISDEARREDREMKI